MQIGSTRSCGCLQNLSEEKYIEKLKIRLIKYIKENENNCWIWQGSKHKQGYGQIGIKGKPKLSHRVAWEIYRGEIPEGVKVCHKCDVTSCYNPDHLFLGSQMDNVQDAIEKGKYENRAMGKRRNKLNFSQVQEIRKFNAEGMTRRELQEKFDVGQTCIAKILNGISWNINWTEEL